MRAAAGLLLLLIGLYGSQAQLEGDADFLSFKALNLMLVKAMSRLSTLEKEVNQLRAELARETSKVAFYAALSDNKNTGPFKDGMMLKYSKVFTNVGEAYNNLTGVFTAPVEGVYNFQFTAFGYTSCTIRLHVYKNNERIMNNWKHSSENVATYLTNSLILELKEGDIVHFYLPAGACLYDDINNYSTITAFLL